MADSPFSACGPLRAISDVYCAGFCAAFSVTLSRPLCFAGLRGLKSPKTLTGLPLFSHSPPCAGSQRKRPVCRPVCRLPTGQAGAHGTGSRTGRQRAGSPAPSRGAPEARAVLVVQGQPRPVLVYAQGGEGPQLTSMPRSRRTRKNASITEDCLRILFHWLAGGVHHGNCAHVLSVIQSAVLVSLYVLGASG